MIVKVKKKSAVMAKIRYDSKIFYFYFKKISQELKKLNWKRTNKIYVPYVVKFKTTSILYNHEAFKLLQKAFKRMGWRVKMNHYSYVPSYGGQYEIKVERRYNTKEDVIEFT